MFDQVLLWQGDTLTRPAAKSAANRTPERGSMHFRTTQAQEDRLDQIDTSHFVANKDCLTSLLPKAEGSLVAVTDHEDRPHYLVVDQKGGFGPATRKQAYAYTA